MRLKKSLVLVNFLEYEYYRSYKKSSLDNV